MLALTNGTYEHEKRPLPLENPGSGRQRSSRGWEKASN
jgi:hypothetical protein